MKILEILNEVKVDGQEIKVGDWVSFKSDIEQSGQIKAFKGRNAILVDPDGFSGDYIGGSTETEVPISDLWIE